MSDDQTRSVENAHRFTDQEVAQVLKRSAEIEESRASEATGHGVNLAELREIAREVGLPPESIDQTLAAIALGRGRGVRDATRVVEELATAAKELMP